MTTQPFHISGFHPLLHRSSDLKVYNHDNGLFAHLEFYVRGEPIDRINLESVLSLEAWDSDVLNLPVLDYHDRVVTGTVRDDLEAWIRLNQGQQLLALEMVALNTLQPEDLSW